MQCRLKPLILLLLLLLLLMMMMMMMTVTVFVVAGNEKSVNVIQWPV